MRTIWRDNLPQSINPLSFVLFVSKPHITPAIFASACIIVASLLSAAVPFVYKLITDSLITIEVNGFEPVFFAVGLYFAISVASHLLWRGTGFIGMHWVTGARSTARSALVAYLTKHSYQYFSDRFSGSLLSKVKQGADGAKDLIEAFLWQILGFIVPVTASFIIVFSTNYLIGLLLVGLLVVIVPFNYYFAKKRIPLSIASQSAETALSGVMVDALANITSVHEYAKRDFEMDRIKSFIMRRHKLNIKNWQYGEWLLFWNGLFINAFMGAMVFLAVYLAQQGVITPGDIVLFVAMVWLLEERFIFIGNQFNKFSEIWGQLSESLADITRTHDVADHEDAKELKVSRGTLAFDDASFSYGAKNVFEHLSFALSPGEKIGMVGKSGAGKSTLMKLVLRHYDLTGGRILVDGTDIAKVTKESLRSAIAVVPQEPSLFHRTIRENIAYAKPDASMEEVIRAAKQAQAHEFITTLPDGYESLVGERGVKLSGGQRQRVAIARAILKDAPILLLDEATSALDSESEGEVQKALLELMKGRTVIAIAHRLSTLRAMDRLMVFDAGKIIEDGTHEELLRNGGIYSELWNHQAGGFITDDSEKEGA